MADRLMSIGIGGPCSHDALVHQVEPIAQVSTDEVAQDSISAGPIQDLQGREAGVEEIGYGRV